MVTTKKLVIHQAEATVHHWKNQSEWHM